MKNLNPAGHIFLTGFMGSGKTTSGRLLAELLNRPFIDLDEIISQNFKASIKDIINHKGEAAFRVIERKALVKLAGQNRPSVISTGGGLVINPDNRKLMAQTGTIFFLDAPLEILAGRLSKKERLKRPLWADMKQAEKLYQERKPWYHENSRVISALGSTTEIAHQIASFMAPKIQAELKVENHLCQLETVWPNALPEVLKFTGERKKALFLDAALKNDLLVWQKAGFLSFPIKKSGEAVKTIKTATDFLGALMNWGLARDDTLVVRGGGSLTDAGAFCAGLYKRGLNLILAPTTLLGAVDAAVGGKTALNFKGAKNQIGHFYLPQAVLVDVFSFKTLKKSQLSDGLVEAYKTGLLGDPGLAALIENNLDALLKGDIPLLNQVAGRGFQIKASFVARDFREELGIRDVLNLGHTYGHVVESYSNYKVSHGRAVALGLIVAARLSAKKAGLPQAEAERIINTVSKMAVLPPYPPREQVAGFLKHDKKVRSGSLGFILLPEVGRAELTRNLVLDDILTAASPLDKD